MRVAAVELSTIHRPTGQCRVVPHRDHTDGQLDGVLDGVDPVYLLDFNRDLDCGWSIGCVEAPQVGRHLITVGCVVVVIIAYGLQLAVSGCVADVNR